jgi:SAM-dependent methyltransferase
MTKKLEAYGVAAINFTDAETAAGYTYTKNTGELASTPLIFAGNPFNADVESASCILDLGCGVGRNLRWIMENTNAKYIGLDPNLSMLKYFWENQKYDYSGYAHRITLVSSFDELAGVLSILGVSKIDVVVCTFVFQHIGFRTSEGQMNVADITKGVQRFTQNNAAWIMYEHDGEERWIEPWLEQCYISPVSLCRNFYYPELTDRGLHHFIAWRG